MSDMAAQTSEDVRLRPITVEEYHLMGETGIIGPDERVQLVSGRIIQMPPMGPKHAYHLTMLHEILRTTFQGRAAIRSQIPLTLDGYSEPEPDFAVVRAPQERYQFQHPTAADAFLVIEVSDSTLRTDRGEKLLAYAEGGIPEYWIVNLVDRTLEIYTKPAGSAFRHKRIVRSGERVAAQAFPADEISVDDILPPTDA